MPSISYFYGIKIYIFWNDSQHHRLPHFHAHYAEHIAAFDLQGKLLMGHMPNRAKKLIKIWALEKNSELVYAWGCAVDLKVVPQIEGLE
jgi:hypothetical protein